MSVKERVYQALKSKNYFEFGKKDSLEVFTNATSLEDLIIQVERNCNVDQPLFRYNPVTHKFYRVAISEKDKELLERETLYNVHPECKKRGCLSREIKVETFIKLMDFVFEPIAVYEVSEVETI